jgi:hypothetical protein
LPFFSKRQEQLWLEREAIAQVAFQKMKEREERREGERIEQEVCHMPLHRNWDTCVTQEAQCKTSGVSDCIYCV